MSGGWQPIETAPKDGLTWILVCEPGMQWPWMVKFRLGDGPRIKGRWESMLGRLRFTPTLWQTIPLPPPPQRAEAEEDK